jgi:DNA-binding NarL/FixJ family response regulator
VRGRKGRVKLLIVDDSAIVREVLIDSLSEVSGIEIAGEASNALEGIEMIRRLRPDVIVLDFKMPGGNGLSVLKELQSEDFSPLVLMFTNYPHLQYRDACLNAGAHYFFDKSTEFHNVIETLEQIARPPAMTD